MGKLRKGGRRKRRGGRRKRESGREGRRRRRGKYVSFVYSRNVVLT